MDGSGEVCLPKQGDCPAHSEAAKEALHKRHQVSCPTLSTHIKKEPVVKKNSEGGEECCYQVNFYMCEGRPLLVQGQQRKAPLRGNTWS